MLKIFVKCDTNDADYIGNIVEVDEEAFELCKPIIEKIKSYRDKNGFGKWGCGEFLEEGNDPRNLYGLNDEDVERFEDILNLHSCASEYGFHTIKTIQVVEIKEKYL